LKIKEIGTVQISLPPEQNDIFLENDSNYCTNFPLSSEEPLLKYNCIIGNFGENMACALDVQIQNVELIATCYTGQRIAELLGIHYESCGL
jgi:hypothetical protein